MASVKIHFDKLNDLPAELPAHIELTASEKVAQKTAEMFSMTPVQLAHILTRDIEGDVSITLIDPGKADDPSIRISMRSSKDGHSLFSYHSSFVNDENHVSTADITVEDSFKARGLGSKMLRNGIEFRALAGMTSMQFNAGRANGGYRWARARMIPYKDAQNVFDEKFVDVVEHRIDLLKKCTEICPMMLEEADDIDLGNDPEDVWVLADLGTDDEGEIEDILPEMEQALEMMRSQGGLLADDFEKEFGDIIRRAGKTSRHNGLTLGQVLLMGTKWFGICDLTDEEQMTEVNDRFAETIGGFDYISVEM